MSSTDNSNQQCQQQQVILSNSLCTILMIQLMINMQNQFHPIPVSQRGPLNGRLLKKSNFVNRSSFLQSFYHDDSN